MEGQTARQLSDYPPMLRQYMEIKLQHPDDLLFFRMGDFYELFFEDAKQAADLLNLTLTYRGQVQGIPVPMAGVPHHSASSYFKRVLDFGRTLVVAEQDKERSQEGKLMERRVERILTPGTLVEEGLLADKKRYCLAGVFPARKRTQGSAGALGLAIVDVAASRGYLCQVPGLQDLDVLLSTCQVAECLVPEEQGLYDSLRGDDIAISACCDDEFSRARGARWLEQAGESRSDWSPEIQKALGALAAHVTRAFGKDTTGLCRFERLHPEGYIGIDPATARNLDLIGEGSLLSLLDRCATPMGSRTLSDWVRQPLRDVEPIVKRSTFIALLRNSDLKGLQRGMAGIGDLERQITRLGARNQHSVLKKISTSLSASLNFGQLLGNYDHEFSNDFCLHIESLRSISQELDSAIGSEEEETLIAAGYDARLDAMRSTNRNFDSDLDRLRQQVVSETAMQNVKIGYHRVHGYFVEVRRSESKTLPQNYRRTQTLKHTERFTFPELEALEHRVSQSLTEISEYESRLVAKIARQVLAEQEQLSLVAGLIGAIDALIALAKTSLELGWQPAEHTGETLIDIKDAWHPLVAAGSDDAFVPNSFYSDAATRLTLVTGPNMGGKSTYMRQIALVLVLAFMGCPVPARSALIGPVDRLFCRLGARDDIAKGKSTFMVEMSEMAGILHQASSNSFVVVDEIGRGTSTAEGAAIAQAVAEYLVQNIGAVVVFATHFAELQSLVNRSDVVAIHLEALVEKDTTGQERAHFTHRIKPGFMARSYAYEVAQLAGIPHQVIDKARSLSGGHAQPLLMSALAGDQAQSQPDAVRKIPARSKHAEKILADLQNLKIDDLTAKQALDLLYKLYNQASQAND